MRRVALERSVTLFQILGGYRFEAFRFQPIAKKLTIRLVVLNHDCDLILREGAIDIVRLVMREEVERGDRLNEIAWAPARAQPPNDVLARKSFPLVEKSISNVLRVSPNWEPKR